MRPTTYANRGVALLTIALLATLLSGDVSGEIILLANGGRIEGQVLNQEKFPREYLIQTPEGGRITLRRAQVKKVLRRRPAEVEYEKEVHNYPDTTVGQLALAEWCRKNYLSNQRTAHLQRVVELDPDHEKARRLLGYSRYDGRWMTRRQWNEKNGLILYDGKYRSAQEIELMERERKGDLAQKAWFRKLNLWHEWIGKDAQRRAAAEQNIRAINDPYAVKGMVKYFAKENRQRVKLWYVEAFGKIPSSAAVTALVNYSLDDPDQEVAISCFEALKKRKSPTIVRMYVKMLREKDNQRVQRAAIGLNYMGDSVAMGPLIDALVTTHTYTIRPGSKPGSISSTFNKPGSAGASGNGLGGGGLGVGGNRPKRITQQMHNPEVLSTLVALSGVNYDYDKAQWRKWLAAQKKASSLDVRRD